MKLRKIKSISFVLTLCFLLPSCTMVSKNSLSDPNSATFESSLLGVWKDCKQDKKCTYLHIGKGKHNKTIFHFVGYGEEDHLLLISFKMFPTTVDNNYFMNIERGSKDNMAYDFARYKLIDKGTFSFAYIDREQVEEAIKQGVLAGKAPDVQPLQEQLH